MLVVILLSWITLSILDLISIVLQARFDFEIWPSIQGYVGMVVVVVFVAFLMLEPHFLQSQAWQPPKLLHSLDERTLAWWRRASMLFALAPLAALIIWMADGGTMRFVGLGETYEALEQPLNAIFGMLAMSIALIPLILLQITVEVRQRRAA